MVSEIPLTKGYVALVDDEDFEGVSKFTWYAEVCGNSVYACRRDYSLDHRPKEYLHRRLMEAKAGDLIDHRNQDSLDCARENLRRSDKSGNSSNRAKMAKPTLSQFKGVSMSRGRWFAQIEAQGVRQYLGVHPTEEAAARAYDVAASHAFGPFASLNFRERP